ncbi:sigma-70 family RNA polymerase sigma factor [Actinomadura parmotrematis]|uniref:Sigma-70 family RNA polymerase sigma factor n=1 Tax=Actinomadura parmotrematis TaxID=2864039 RepID=A0ABS7FUA7_9ACTN|nr:sigma-70 family RNA polymerase sigma factor [Actinomadura parmotrematis]MBW8483113.1 sigma-70 family RNA polymerase sigma factor [Actinomadura parmotrematis]
MDTLDPDGKAALFEEHRPLLRAAAQRMLGSAGDAEDAVQDAWLRFARADTADVRNPAAWLTTVTGRVCLDMLRARRPRPAARDEAVPGPEDDVLMAEEVGRALLVVLDRLPPAERVAFVLHDAFAVPFDEIAPIVGRTPAAAKKLASRARARVRGAGDPPAVDAARHRAVVDAFLAAARGRDVDGLLAVLAPDVVRRTDLPGRAPVVRGARAVAEETLLFAAAARNAVPITVDGAPGLVVAPAGRARLVLAVTVEGGRVTAYDVVSDPAMINRFALSV